MMGALRCWPVSLGRPIQQLGKKEKKNGVGGGIKARLWPCEMSIYCCVCVVSTSYSRKSEKKRERREVLDDLIQSARGNMPWGLHLEQMSVFFYREGRSFRNCVHRNESFNLRFLLAGVLFSESFLIKIYKTQKTNAQCHLTRSSIFLVTFEVKIWKGEKHLKSEEKR